MIKYLILLLNFIGLLLFNFFFGEVSVSINAPNEVNSGSDFTVEMTFSKSDLSGFARYYQELPIGYTATDKNSYNGTFSFKDQKVKILWNPKIPSDSIFTITYNIHVDNTVEGTLNLGGSFTYVFENQLKTINVPIKSVIVRPQGFVANNQNGNNQQNSIDTTNNNNLNTSNFPSNEIFCYRQIERNNDGIIIHLLINTASLAKDKFARIQEKIPTGYTASNIESKDGIFNFKDNNAKFLWMALPAENQFQVSYKLTATAFTSEFPDISGSFSYVENDESKVISIINRDFINAQVYANNTVNNQNNNQNQNNNNQNQQTNNGNNNQNNNQTVDTVNKNLITQKKNNINNNNNNNNQNNNNLNNITVNNNTVNNQTITSPETGIRYKVQIAAGHTPVNPKYYFNQFNVTEKVQMEMHEGWHKYTIGSFTIYKDARDRRVQIWENTPIRDAFVSAYNNGSRITVQEALMVANQKWYQ